MTVQSATVAAADAAAHAELQPPDAMPMNDVPEEEKQGGDDVKQRGGTQKPAARWWGAPSGGVPLLRADEQPSASERGKDSASSLQRTTVPDASPADIAAYATGRGMHQNGSPGGGYWCASLHGYWSSYYEHHARQPMTTTPAPWVAGALRRRRGGNGGAGKEG